MQVPLQCSIAETMSFPKTDATMAPGKNRIIPATRDVEPLLQPLMHWESSQYWKVARMDLRSKKRKNKGNHFSATNVMAIHESPERWTIAPKMWMLNSRSIRFPHVRSVQNPFDIPPYGIVNWDPDSVDSLYNKVQPPFEQPTGCFHRCLIWIYSWVIFLTTACGGGQFWEGAFFGAKRPVHWEHRQPKKGFAKACCAPATGPSEANGQNYPCTEQCQN